LVLAVILLWPSSEPPPPPETSPAAPARNTERAKEVDALLVAGELLFGEGRYVAPPDRPDEDNAYAKFNEALALDPGNEKARDWLKRIDVKLEESRRLREETERRRREAEEAKLAAERARLQAKIDAIVAVGDGLFDAGKVAEPAGNNALARYEEALKLDPENAGVQERIRRAVFHYVQIGDDFRDKGDNWRALEQYRKGQRAAQRAGLKDADVTARVTEVEKVLKSGMASSQNYLILYKDDRGQLHVLDEMEKVPAKYRDRAVEVQPAPTPPP
jgi:tetratricopeptide (TPR) repeat protein